MTPIVSTSCLCDQHGRTITYARISVTDRCNVRCLYCHSDHTPFIAHKNIMRYEDWLPLIGKLVELGIEKIRITGGEPFARKDCILFLERLRNAHPQLNLCLTTNGTLLQPYIKALKELEINVNLSLDTFDRAHYANITGHDLYPKVYENLMALLAAKVPLKLNAVGMYGINHTALPVFLRFASTYKVDVRFIEFMPMGSSTSWTPALFWSAKDIVQTAQNIMPLTACPALATDSPGPARMYDLPNGGRFGVITPLSNHFCLSCNRLRITSDGRLRTCLYDDKDYILRNILRHPKLGIKKVQEVLQRAVQRKAMGNTLLTQEGTMHVVTPMHRIGG